MKHQTSNMTDYEFIERRQELTEQVFVIKNTNISIDEPILDKRAKRAKKGKYKKEWEL